MNFTFFLFFLFAPLSENLGWCTVIIWLKIDVHSKKQPAVMAAALDLDRPRF